MADEQLDNRVKKMPDPGDERVRRRSLQSPVAEEAEAEDPEAQARALLSESDARIEDPAAGNTRDPRVDHRTSDESTPPVEQ